MDFAFTEDQRAIAEAVRTLLVEGCTPADLRALPESGKGQDPARVAALREMGLFGVLAPEARGGLGLSPVEFAGVAEAAGYVALPEPLIEPAGIAVPLLASLEDDRGWLARVLDGATVAVGSPTSAFVLDADTAEVLLLPHGDEIHLVEHGAVELLREESLDGLRRLYRVVWTPTTATRVGAGWDKAHDLGALWTAGQLIGLGQRAIDIAAAYAKERTQFGKPIGSFQAVKHLLATAQVKIEFARPVFHAAAAEIGTGPAAAARVSHAKLAAAAAAEAATRASIQAHGAIGMTREASVHHYFKRALALRSSWGDLEFHRARVVRRMRDLPTGPEFTFASQLAAADA